ncbi:MAG TPA: hypothetical protein VFE70_01010 [Candidatus Elarobacter sp.]|nr:hypothetical protein [Candidatus Elarobacter sp.]
MVLRPLVFVAMPFGVKLDALRVPSIDFDAIYEKGIKPALSDLDVDFIRADGALELTALRDRLTSSRGLGGIDPAAFEEILVQLRENQLA